MIGKVDERLQGPRHGHRAQPEAKELLAKKGYDPVLGARPLRRTIQREIEDTLSEKILFGELRPGHIVVVDTEGEGDDARRSPSAARRSRRCPTSRRSSRRPAAPART